MKPKFILGVGAQKAGTTWLHRNLNRQPNINMGFAKEYHVWDANFCSLSHGFKQKLQKPDTAKQAMIRLMQESNEVYGKYFSGLVKEEVVATGDITPAYALLSEENFSFVNRFLTDLDFDVKTIFLMRDPFERYWSAVCHKLQRLSEKREKIPDEELGGWLLSEMDNAQNKARNDYLTTIKNIENAFDQNQIFFGFFESLFTAESVRGLEGYLGIELPNVDVQERFNVSFKIDVSVGTKEHVRKEFNAQYEAQYLACFDRFPITKELWNFEA